MWADLQAIALRRSRVAVPTQTVFWEQSSPSLCHQFSKGPHHIYTFVFITPSAPFCTNKNYTAFCTIKLNICTHPPVFPWVSGCFRGYS